MTQALVNKTCTSKVRRAASIQACADTIKTVTRDKVKYEICPNKENHLHPMVTGFCHSGWHEGHKINKPTCKFWIVCPCDCHTNISRMMEIAEMERVLQDNSNWSPPKIFVRIDRAEIAAERVVAAPGARVIQSEAPMLMPNRVERDFAPTESGRAARGQLEAQVREVTDVWVSEPGDNCTPQYVKDQIIKLFGETKSTGAIDAVFRRWSDVGFATIAAKPTRFVGYTPAGIQQGLEALRAKAKQK